MRKKYAFHRVVDFLQYVSCIFMNYGSQESCERDVQASFEGVAGEREELSFLSSPLRLPPSIDCPPYNKHSQAQDFGYLYILHNNLGQAVPWLKDCIGTCLH